ncbi:MAG: hypothetical protein ACT4OI_05720 [Methanobacteriota archaeon]
MRTSKRLVNEFVRSGLLAVLSLLLVLGFYVHSSFYALGFVPLIVAGTTVTFLVITAGRAIVVGRMPRSKPAGDLTFRPEQAQGLLATQNAAFIASLESEVPFVGEMIRADDESGVEFARLLTVDCRRKFVSDVTAEDARRAGFSSLEAFLAVARDEWGLDPDGTVSVVDFRHVGAGP